MNLRYIVIALMGIFLIRSYSSVAQWGSHRQKKNDWTEMHLKGKVKTMQVYSYDAYLDSGKIKKGKPTNNDENYKSIFNAKGYLSLIHI